MIDNSDSEQEMKNQLGATISVWWDEVGLVSISISPEDWYDIQIGEEVELTGNGVILDGGKIQDKWLFKGGDDGFLDVTYADGDHDYVVGVSAEFRDAHIIEHPTPHRKPKKTTNFTHEEMASIVKKQTYSTCSGCIGESDTRPFVFGRFILPVAYVHYDVPDVNTTIPTYWPEGNIVGHLRNAIERDMIIFPGWKGNTRCQNKDVIYDLRASGWVMRR